MNDIYDDLSYEIAQLAEESIDPPSVYLDPKRLQQLIEEAGIKHGHDSLRDWMTNRKYVTGSYPTGEEVMDWITE
jgi:hypothetical protein